MRLDLLCAAPLPCSWISSWLEQHDRLTEHHDLSSADPESAVATGHQLADRWRDDPPDAVLAVGWAAGLAAQVATRDRHVDVVLRLTRVCDARDAAAARLERATARGSRLVLAPSVGVAQRLVDRGVPRASLRVLPEAVDRGRFADEGAASGGASHRIGVRSGTAGRPGAGPAGLVEAVARAGLEPVGLAPDQPDHLLAPALRSVDALVVVDDTDEDVALTLRAMSCGVPAVAVDHGVLSDVVADGVTGLLVPRAQIIDSLRLLVTDPMRREAMGLAAVDRAQARFDVSVVGPVLDRALGELAGGADEGHTGPAEVEDEAVPA